MVVMSSAYIEKSWRNALSRLRCGILEFVAPNGELTIVRGTDEGPCARFELRDWEVLRRVAAKGDVALGEAYVDGGWETDNIEKLISLFLLNIDELDSLANGSLFNRLAMVL